MRSRNFILKWHKNIGFSILVHLFGFIFSFAFVMLYFEKSKELLFLSISIFSIILVIISFLYSFYFGWNKPIYFDNEKIWCKIKGKIYEWKWEDITDYKVKRRLWASRNNPMAFRIIMTTKPEYEKLIFEWSVRREKMLLEICPNQEVKLILEKAFKEE